jgi:hypothetical protein
MHRRFAQALQERREAWFDAFREHVRVWTGYVVAAPEAAAFGRGLGELLSGSASVDCIQIFIIRRPTPRGHFALAPTPAGDVLVGFGVYAMISRWRPAALHPVLRALDEVLAQCAALGGRPYLYGYHGLTPALKQRIYGAEIERLAALRPAAASFLNPESFGRGALPARPAL